MTVDEATTKLTKYLPKYTKPDIQPVFPTLKTREGNAISHSKRVRSEHQNNGNDLHSRTANPHTYVDLIVELLNSF